MASEEDLDVEASFEGGDLDDLVSHLRTILNIQDRKYGFPSKTYPKCFVGSQAVRALVDEGIASDGDDAVHIGNMLLNAGMFHHVQHAHTFKDEYLFCRFASDEDHGTVTHKPDGNRTSWSEFIAPLTSAQDQAFAFQPAIPERDPELATFAQDNLDACGRAPLYAHSAKLLDHTHPKAWADPSPKDSYNLVVIVAGAGIRSWSRRRRCPCGTDGIAPALRRLP